MSEPRNNEQRDEQRDEQRSKQHDAQLSEQLDAQLDAQVRASYQRAQVSDAAARSRVLARLAEVPPSASHAGARRASQPHAGLRWWFAAQPFALRPAWGVAALALVLLGGAWLGVRFAGGAGHARDLGAVPKLTASTAAAAAGAPVTFVLRAPGATRVSVAGDFNNWDAEATPMAHSGTGDMWILSLRLPRGVHMYSFVLDGSEWRPDPSAPLAADEAFGGHNSVIVVNGAKEL